MDRPKLYYFIGYPGAGKTTLAKLISDRSGALHIWADDERHKLFPEATHTTEESLKLYDLLNKKAEELLRQRKSVVFDTNFNFYVDRQVMCAIASRQNAEPVLIWLNLPKQIAKNRAVCKDKFRNGYKVSMSGDQFDSIANKLEPPKEEENAIVINSEKLDSAKALTQLGL